jgi:hypothetical protein
MGRELRIVGFVVLAAIAFSLLGAYNEQPAKPMSTPLPKADESKPERRIFVSGFICTKFSPITVRVGVANAAG